MERGSVFLVLSLCLCLTSCDFFDYDVWEKHKIKAGDHFSGLGVEQVSANTLAYKVRFDSTVVYDLGNVNQDDINKLFGFSGSFRHHQQESARFGWRWNLQKEQVEIFAYMYINGNRISYLMGEADVNEVNEYRIHLTKNGYHLKFKGNHKFYKAPAGVVQFRYKLFPYFGGDQPAPHDMTIHMKRIYE
ncbi:hypothetical protein FUAX_45920 (plasmid) [Fulvitalea axinellae]|uniref:Lipoprotein n=1 Tax=Fulvitalea axinellae TaxID=1182444 RepID=A0AAU9DLT8_9BACT|nr:hypothetical protein FUAX_45920 [Fulvitalea axinellae]